MKFIGIMPESYELSDIVTYGVYYTNNTYYVGVISGNTQDIETPLYDEDVSKIINMGYLSALKLSLSKYPDNKVYDTSKVPFTVDFKFIKDQLKNAILNIELSKQDDIH